MENKIGKNISSGAEKVETVEKEFTADTVDTGKPKTKKTSKTVSKTVKKTPRKTVAEKKEEEAADKRFAAAKDKARAKEEKLLKKAEIKQKKLEKKAAAKQKKLERKELVAKKRAERKQARLEHKAALKEKRVERKAERIARKEMLRNESKTDRRNRIEREKKERIALRTRKHQARVKAREDKRNAKVRAKERRAEDKKHRREQRTERKNNRRGFGGWLAAVITLGAATLALATVVTAGAFRMNDITLQAESGYRSTLYELTSVSEDMDNNLDKLRVATGANEQRKLLTDLLVDTALMESALERIPVDSMTSTDISAYVNKTGSYARSLLSRLASGKALTQRELNTVSYLYGINSKIYNELNGLVTEMTAGDFSAFLKGEEGTVSQKFGEMGQSTLAEPEDAVDAPFSGEGNVGENKLSSLEHIDEQRAEELVKQYLEGYHVAEVEYTGETIAREMSLYDFTLTDDSGNEIFAQITQNGGKLAFFDTYEACEQKNFDLETCDGLARDFLASLGYGDVEAVWLSDAGMVADITYVGVQNGVRAYPDMIRVRVCESRGRVVGIEASGYLLNHGERTYEAGLSREEAGKLLAKGLKPYSAHLALIPVDGEETLAYEFGCTYGEEEFIVYLDAVTGEEVQVYRVRTSSSGSFLR